MSITHCPTCEEPLRQFPSCGQCVNPYCNDYTRHPRLSPLPGHQDLDACLAALAQVDQVGGTPMLAQFQDHLLSQKQALSSIPEMAGKVLAIDSALHELDLYLSLKGLI